MANQKETAVNTTIAPAEGKSMVTVPGTMTTMWTSIKRFFREVMIELKKTIWPTKNELTKYTVVVLATIVAVAAFLSLADWLGSQLTRITFGL